MINRIAVVLTVILIVTGIVVMVFFNQSDEVDTTNPTSTDPPSLQDEGEGLPEAHDDHGHQHQEKPDSFETKRTALHEAVVKFEEAYHTFTYKDTAESRLKRILPYVSETPFRKELRDRLSFGNSNAGQSIVDNKLSQNAVQADVYSGEFIDEKRACIHALVAVQTSRPGEKSDPIPIQTTRYWIETPAGWQVERDARPSDQC